jgi:hypothetical protein
LIEIEKVLSIRREGRLTWLPNALKYQPPSNPNAVRCWGKSWDDVPECSIKTELWQALKIACKSWSVLFAKGFAEPLTNGSMNGSMNGYPNRCTQEQEQKQDQDQEQDLVTRLAPLPAKRPRKSALPADWKPDETALVKAREFGVDANLEADSFRDHHTAKGSTFVDWQAAFRTWLGNAKRFARGGGATRESPTETMLGMIADVEARTRASAGTADLFASSSWPS